ncbi:hypothetical protein FRB96_008865 [Tulasnella sp. 330]|nr:hypothetical protein FRB96_008865 [Tulasnella sp. 330]KAG8880588.1 hypothetical protein FRB97_000683 [Tulasnella sp. 331]KAG8884495.1 hypothetical protein FRB98_002358 [Tulasnella sp. 332]
MATFSRKYIQMIKQTSARIPNWNPGSPLRLGDFGRIDEVTGEFRREGNIYSTKEITDKYPLLLTPQGQPQLGCKDDKMIVCAENTSAVEWAISGDIGNTMLAKAEIKVEFKIEAPNRGAFLLMYQPQTSFFGPDVDMRELAQCERLENYQLVTEVTICPAYVMCLTGKNERTFKVALLAESPVPLHGITAGGAASFKWWSDRNAGLFRDASDPTGNPSFATLVKLQVMTRGWKEWFFRMTRRDSPPIEPKHIAGIWVDAAMPWRPIDDDDKEEEFEDTVFSDSDDDMLDSD